MRERLRAYRLVTLTGSGGVGKTRLAQHVAIKSLDNFQDGVWFIELAPLSDPEEVGRYVARSLVLLEDPGTPHPSLVLLENPRSPRPVLESLAQFIYDQQILIVLDNCEHVLEACARLADGLLRVCPRLRVLATSREPFGIDGEAIFHVPSLPFPDPQ